MDNTIIQQGRFTSDGNKKILSIRSDVDWMEVINETQWATTQTPGRGVKFEWQRGLTAGHAFEYTKADGANTLQAEKVTSGGFTLIDPNAGIGAAVTGTTITKASPAVCTANGHGYSNGDQVILSNLTNMPQIGVVVFTIGSVTTNTFELSYLNTNTANFTAETAFQVRKLPAFGWDNGYNYISAVTTGATTQVQLTSDDDSAKYEVGQILKFNVPSAFGMTELDGQQAEITAYNSSTNTYTVDLDSSAYTAFAWPASTAYPLSHATVELLGNNSSSVLEATKNLSNLKIELGAGIDGPAGSSSDVIYWRAGKSFSVSN